MSLPLLSFYKNLDTSRLKSFLLMLIALSMLGIFAVATKVNSSSIVKNSKTNTPHKTSIVSTPSVKMISNIVTTSDNTSQSTKPTPSMQPATGSSSSSTNTSTQSDTNSSSSTTSSQTNTNPTSIPTAVPTQSATVAPTATPKLTNNPTVPPTTAPTATLTPTAIPTAAPTPVTSDVYITAYYGATPVYQAWVVAKNHFSGEKIGEGFTDGRGDSPHWRVAANTQVDVTVYPPANTNWCGNTWTKNTGSYGTTTAENLQIYPAGTANCIKTP